MSQTLSLKNVYFPDLSRIAVSLWDAKVGQFDLDQAAAPH
jgi:hypothetical protein